MDNDTIEFVTKLFDDILESINYLFSILPPDPPLEYRDLQESAYNKGYAVCLVAMENEIKDAKRKLIKRVLNEKIEKILSFDHKTK